MAGNSYAIVRVSRQHDLVAASFDRQWTLPGSATPATAKRRLPITGHSSSYHGYYALGRGCGVGRVLGVGIFLGVGVGRGVAVAVAVGVGVTAGVVVGVGVTVGVGVALAEGVGVGDGGGPPGNA